jgi:hypothetical protein
VRQEVMDEGGERVRAVQKRAENPWGRVDIPEGSQGCFVVTHDIHLLTCRRASPSPHALKCLTTGGSDVPSGAETDEDAKA